LLQEDDAYFFYLFKFCFACRSASFSVVTTGETIFAADCDCLLCLELLKQAADRYSFYIHAHVIDG
jgi:hypothetical protein